MTTIRTTCPRCGEVDMGPASIVLAVQGETGEGSYRFLCPACLDPVEKLADRRIVALLVSAGVDFADEDLETASGSEDQGVPHREYRYPGPALTQDDLIDFHFLLQDDNLLAEALLSS